MKFLFLLLTLSDGMGDFGEGGREDKTYQLMLLRLLNFIKLHIAFCRKYNFQMFHFCNMISV